MSKKTLVLGASPTPVRYAYKAVRKLNNNNYEVIAIGKQSGDIDGVPIIKDMPHIENLHTVTMYLNAEKQEKYIDYIIELEPKRIIFNPGSYNNKLEKRAKEAGIEVVEDCTLVMIDTDSY